VDNIAPENQEEAERDEPLVKSKEAATGLRPIALEPAANGPRPQAPAEPFVEDGRADLALDFVIDVLAAMGMDCTVDLLENEEEDPPEEIRLEIEGKDAGRIIGKKGQTLAALQFLANRVINRPGKQRRHVIIDAEGYRARREETLSSMARRLGRQAVDEGKIITFEPMNPQDRRVVHMALANFAGVITKSDGEGDARRV
jgi:spoIIIJ-associated protein